MVIIYKAELNGKLYIGITNNFSRRKNVHKHLSKNPKTYFHKAINKYGWNNVKWSILEEVKSWEIAKKLEIKYIDKYETLQKGYNLTKGGDGQLGVSRIPWNKGKKTPKSVREKQSKSHMGKKNQEVTQETKNKISVALKNKPKSLSHKNNLSKAQKKRFSDKKVRDKMSKIKKDYYTQEVRLNLAKKLNNKPIYVYDKNMNYINTYETLLECANHLKLHKSNICHVLSGKYSHTGGYFFTRSKINGN